MKSASGTGKPLLALAMGDPCGISCELTARLVANRDIARVARLLVIGDRRMLAVGNHHAGLEVEPAPWRAGDSLAFDGHRLLDLGHGDPRHFEPGVVSEAGGHFALTNFTTALTMARDGDVDAVTFTPFNKQAMRLARPGYEDEIALVTETLGAERDGREFNILEGLWNARVTSHVALKDVAARITVDALVDAAALARACMIEAGFAQPRIAVAGLNPHAGDGGNFGREEIDIIAPAVATMIAQGIEAKGPIPADTVFVRARKGEFDAVLTMYHDQGQIAMKLMGFESGVTLLGGYPVPICTPAHGTAYDIVGRGMADDRAARNALIIAARMAERHRRSPPPRQASG